MTPASDTKFSAEVEAPQPAAIPPAAVVFLLLTATISLLWSHFKLMWCDEFFVLWTDRAASLMQVIHIQRTNPIAIDPLAYHALAHAAIRIFGQGAFAIRLPSLLGFLLMQMCLFIFVRRIAGNFAAIFALAFPALTATLVYAVEARPYGLMLGLFGLVMVTWQTAVRRNSHRTAPLILLAIAIALTLNTHYYGVLLLPPLLGAELFRTIQRRRLDVPVIAAIASGTAGIIFILPFLKAAGEFRSHYYDIALSASPAVIGTAYLDMLPEFTAAYRHELLFLLLMALIAVCIWIPWSRARSWRIPQAEAVLLILLSALPLFGYLMGRFVTHTVEPRFLLGAIAGISPLLALGLASLFVRKRAANIVVLLAFAALAFAAVRHSHSWFFSHTIAMRFAFSLALAVCTVLAFAAIWLASRKLATNLVLTGLFAAISLAGVRHIQSARQAASLTIAALTLSPESKAVISSSPSHAIYMQNLHIFAVASYYEPDPDVKSRLILVYSRSKEIRYQQIDTLSLTALHMRSFTSFNIQPYESVVPTPGDHLFVLSRDISPYWIVGALADDAVVTQLQSTREGSDLDSDDPEIGWRYLNSKTILPVSVVFRH